MPAETVREKALLEKPRLTREQIAGRAALELPDGAYVNLGWGIPNLIANYLPGEITVYFHSENGILGMGRRAKPGEEDYDLVDAMKIPVTLIPGASFFHQADAHLMTRGGQLEDSRRKRLRRHRRGHGHFCRRKKIDCLHGACHQRRRAENCQEVYLSADRSRMRGHRHHGSRGC